MEELLSKLSHYNLLNNLFPGVVFNFILSKITNINIFENTSLIEKLILCYFIGMIISRIGSQFIEPIAKKLGIIKFAEYDDYITAVKIDTDIKVLSEINNTYRSMVATFLVLLVAVVLNFIFNNEFIKSSRIYKNTSI